MFLDEKETSEQKENSNNENDFKELDNEIDKVIRGETSFDEDKFDKNINDVNSTSNHSKFSTEFIINNNEKHNNIDQNNNDNDIKTNMNSNKKYQNFDSDDDNRINNIKNINQTSQKAQNNLHNNPNDMKYPLINRDIAQFNNNLNFIKNNKSQILNDKEINEENYNIDHSSFNLNNNNNNFCFYASNINNNYNQNNMPYYINNSNEYINNNNNIINNLQCNNNKNNFINNNNFGINNDLINYNSKYNTPSILFDNVQLMKNYNSLFLNQQIPQKSLINNFNEINNNNNINNYININVPIASINFNPFISNFNNKIVPIYSMNNNYNNNNPNLNNFNNNSNNVNNLNYYNQSNNFGGNCGNNFYNNMNNINLNNEENDLNDEIILNKRNNKREKLKKNNKRIIDLTPNKNINDESNDSNLNYNNNNNFKKNKKAHSNKTINRYNPEKTNYSNKRKVFNPIPDSERKKNIINLIDILKGKDLRTTLMIKNIPNKYTISTFLEEINGNFKDTYDIFYLPIDYINKCNLGFAFINFVEPLHIIYFYELYTGKRWKKFNSDKICELLYAKFQGKKELIAHFEKGKVLSFDSEDKRPLILPTPNPLPKINLPYYYLNLFIKLYPNITYEINKINKSNNNSIFSESNIFSINGNFKNNSNN